jgi:hypothetical protein
MGHWARNFSPSESSVSMVAAKCEMDWDWLARLTYFDRYAVVLEAFNPSGIRCSAPDQTEATSLRPISTNMKANTGSRKRSEMRVAK